MNDRIAKAGAKTIFHQFVNDTIQKQLTKDSGAAGSKATRNLEKAAKATGLVSIEDCKRAQAKSAKKLDQHLRVSDFYAAENEKPEFNEQFRKKLASLLKQKQERAKRDQEMRRQADEDGLSFERIQQAAEDHLRATEQKKNLILKKQGMARAGIRQQLDAFRMQADGEGSNNSTIGEDANELLFDMHMENSTGLRIAKQMHEYLNVL